MKSLVDRIPKKSFKTAQVSTQKGGGKSKWVQKLYQHCATWSPILNIPTTPRIVASGTRMELPREIMGVKAKVTPSLFT
jgi:hypothetical protein